MSSTPAGSTPSPADAGASSSAESHAHSGAARMAFLAYAAVCYSAFLVVFLYAIGFVGNVIVPKAIDTGTPGALVPSLVINGLLLLPFVVQHTIMARPWFKQRWTRIVPWPIERATFVLLASACLALVFWQWRPLPEPVWSVQAAPLRIALVALSLAGWGMVLVSTFLISHFDLFGLRQAWITFKSEPYQPVGFRLVGFYKLVRHPLMVGFIIAFWATPDMSVGHLFFAIMTTGYIFFGTWVEERDLAADLGEDYDTYRKRVRGFIPIPKRAP